MNSYINRSEGLKVARLLMVLSSVSPLFILWAIRGNHLIPDVWFLSFCTIMVVIPNIALYLRIRQAQNQSDKRELKIGTYEDHRNHIIAYLFAMLLSFYSVNISTWRDFSAALVALSFVILLFWHLNLHYTNIIFALFGFRIFTVYPPYTPHPSAAKSPFVIITRRIYLAPNERIIAYRISNTVYLEVEE